MRKRPTLASLRAGQTLFLVAIDHGRRGTPIVVWPPLTNDDLRCVAWLKVILRRAYYSRRQALRASRELLRRERLAERDMLIEMTKTAKALESIALTLFQAQPLRPVIRTPVFCNESL